MSARAERLVRTRTLDQHRAAIVRRIDAHGSVQHCLDVLGDAVTELSAAVAKLIDCQIQRQPRKKR